MTRGAYHSLLPVRIDALSLAVKLHRAPEHCAPPFLVCCRGSFGAVASDAGPMQDHRKDRHRRYPPDSAPAPHLCALLTLAEASCEVAVVVRTSLQEWRLPWLWNTFHGETRIPSHHARSCDARWIVSDRWPPDWRIAHAPIECRAPRGMEGPAAGQTLSWVCTDLLSCASHWPPSQTRLRSCTTSIVI